MNMGKIIRTTRSLCPVCLTPVQAVHVQRGENVYMEKTCGEHGEFSTIIWRGKPSMEEWRGEVPPIDPADLPPCPEACGLCAHHRQTTCCVMIEVTARCNISCPFCLADSADQAGDPELEEIKRWIDDIAEKGLTFLHLTGGEPTVREDLPEIIQYASDRGFQYIQLNSNGIRLGEEAGYAKRLADCGLSCVFMQFDGTDDQIYLRLRGRELLEVKKRAIEACGACNLGVTLVPMLVPGVNVHNIGDIIAFAVSKSPMVRGVHFQPVSYFGRYPEPPSEEMRITLPEVLQGIVSQSKGAVSLENMRPSGCDHAMCGFHGDFIVMEDGLRPLTRKRETSECCCRPVVPAEKNQQFVKRRWQRPEPSCCGEPDKEKDSFDSFLERAADHGFTITSMAFQDCYNIDLERLRQCSLHVYDNGRIVPFCARYLTKAH